MEEFKNSNSVTLCGVMCEAPVFSHENRNEQYYQFSLEVRRLSGNTDTVHILARKQLLDELEPDGEGKICVKGELRSFNNKSGVGPRLVITVYAREIYFCDDEDQNTVELCGALCRAPNLRTTPMGREICDLMLAVNRHYGRSDYLPCIAWGINAREAAGWSVGQKLRLCGRIQSRGYTKLVDGQLQEKTAYEVSVIGIEAEQ